MAKVPEGFSPLTPVIILDKATDAIETYQKALGATVCGIMKCPKTNKVMHSCLNIGGSTLFVSDIIPEMKMQATGRQEFYIYVDNADQAYDQAKGAGFKGIMDPEDMFWGDRMCALTDTNGNTWKLAHHVRDVPKEEMEAMMKQMAGKS